MSAGTVWEKLPLPVHVQAELAAQARDRQMEQARGGFERDQFAPEEPEVVVRDLPKRMGAWMERRMEMWRARARAKARSRKLELVEALSLGNKRQVMLVRCGTESYLVGGNSTDVQTIVRVGEQRA